MPTDNRSESVDYGKNREFPCIFARVILGNTLVHRGMSCHQLFVLLCHSQQAVPALPQQLHSQRRLPGTRHARFLHPSSQTSSERAQELPTVPIFVTEKVHVGIERNRAIPTKWRTGSSRRCVGGSRHMVDWLENLRASQGTPRCCRAAERTFHHIHCTCHKTIANLRMRTKWCHFHIFPRAFKQNKN